MQWGSICAVQQFRRIALAVSLAALALITSASPAAASVTLGQLAPGSSPPTNCANPGGFDVLQPTVTSGNSYVVPTTVAQGAITSWSHNASADAGQLLAFKVFRQVSGLRYTVVGHDGPRPVTPSEINTFSGFSIPVKSGDVIGLNDGPPSACAFIEPGDQILELGGDLPDGTDGNFIPRTGVRANISAVINPTNTFTLGATTRNKKKGTATLTVNVPNPGELVLAGKGVKSAGATTAVSVSAPGTVKLRIRAKGKKKRALNETGKVKLKPKVTYTPTGGDPSTQSRKLKLKKP